jgi:hypothetical protein
VNEPGLELVFEIRDKRRPSPNPLLANQNLKQYKTVPLAPMLLGLFTLDPPLSPPSTQVDFYHRCHGGGGSIFSPFQAILSTFLFSTTKM